jgi:hypothetical protein
MRARLIHSSPGRLQGAAFGGDRLMQPTGRRMERSRFLRTYGAPPSTTAISLAVPISAETAPLRERDDPLSTAKDYRLASQGAGRVSECPTGSRASAED